MYRKEGVNMHVLKASWEVTRKCNADCPHCYVDGSSDLGELSIDDGHAVLNSLQKGGVRFLTFTGGEPCLAQNIDHYLLQASEMGLHLNLITNGTISPKIVIDMNRSGILDVTVSVLAGDTCTFEEAYQMQRGFFTRQLAFLKSLERFSVNVCLFSRNCTIADARNIAKYLSPFADKIVDVSVFGATRNGRSISHPKVMVDCQELLRVSRVLVGLLAECGIEADYSDNCTQSDSCPLIGSDCPGEVFINPHGQVRPCHALVGFETAGSLVSNSLVSLLTSPEIVRWTGDPAYAFDRRCKATLLHCGFAKEYIENGGGIDSLECMTINVNPDTVVETFGDEMYAYTRSSSRCIYLNNDARELLETCKAGQLPSLLRSLDDDELAAVLSVLEEMQDMGILTISLPTLL